MENTSVNFPFLLRNHKYGLVYDGSIELYDKCLNSQEAELWFKKKNGGNLETIEIVVFGQLKKFVIPLCSGDIKDCTIITDVFRAYIRDKAKQKLYTDIAVGYWDAILKTHECVINKSGWICFFALGKEKKDIEFSTNEEKADYIMLREYMGGYVRVDPYIYTEIDKNGNIIETPINLHSDYTTGGLGITIPNNYTVGLRNLMFGEVMRKFERKSLMQWWQYDATEKMSKITYICGPRRMGKCVHPESLITMYDGSVKRAKDVCIGDYLLASDCKHYVRVGQTGVFYKDMVRLTFNDGSKTIVSVDHLMPTKDNLIDYRNKIWDTDYKKYKQAREIIVGYDHLVKRKNNKQYQYIVCMGKEYIGEGMVVHIQVDGDSLFWCDNILTHNTYWCGFIGIREIVRQSFDIRRAGSPIQVLYIANKSSTFTSVINYIVGMCKEMGKDFNNMFWWDTTTMKGSRVLNFGYGYGTRKTTLGRIIFISAKESDAGLGMSADLIIIDEAALVPRQVVDNIMPIVTLEGAKLVCISTMYENTLKGWFFEGIMEAEKRNISNIRAETLELYKECFHGKKLKPNEANKWYGEAVKKFYEKNPIIALRYTIDDIEIYTEQEKQQAKDNTLKQRGMIAYLSELYARFVDTGKAFDYEGSIIENIDENKKYKYIVIGYDPASLDDKPGLCVLSYDVYKKKMIVLYADYLSSETGQYQEQIKQFAKMQEIYKNIVDIPDGLYKVVDSTQGGTVDAFESSGIFFDRRYRWRGSGESIVESRKIYTEVKIPKDVFISCLQDCFTNGYISIPKKHTNLINELDSYQKIVHSSGKVEYGGIGTNDDIVSALMMAVYYMYNDLGLKFEIANYKDNLITISNQDENAKRNLELLNAQRLQQQKTNDDDIVSLYYQKYVF